jgi:rhamnose utilization protein RhaD (predicted bifunctional aldolase and dehydrogenase)
MELSARIGRDPLLVQASSGNTSIKLDGALWIKASGKWLADAERDDIFVAVNLADARKRLQQNRGLAGLCASSSTNQMSASIETFMHAALPHRVVVHVHSVNTVAWAVRQDARERLTERLAGLRWHWIPYVPSGLPLGREIENAVSFRPDTDVFVLGNHGLVICGPDCDAAQHLLWEVEKRLIISSRPAPEPRTTLLAQLAHISQWRLPDLGGLHILGTDAVSRRILKGGVLFPCQAIFLGPTVPLIPCSVPLSEFKNGNGGQHFAHPFLILEGSGVVVSHRITRGEFAILAGLAQVVQRIGADVPVRYLTEREVVGVMGGDSDRYRESAENRQRSSAGSW